MSKKKLIKRLGWYYPTERFNTYVFFPLIIIYLIYYYGFKNTIFINSGLILCIYLLYQGQLYLGIKYRKLIGEEIDEVNYFNKFKKWRKSNLYLLFTIFISLPLHLHLNDYKLNSFLYWGVFTHLFYVLEHINYYKTQLMYDNKNDFKYLYINKKLKKSSLLKDIDEGKF